MKFKGCLLALLLISILFAPIVYAQSAISSYFKGFYVGAHVGMKQPMFTEKNAYETNIFSTVSGSENFASNNSVSGGFNFGASIVYHRIYLGADLNNGFGQTDIVTVSNLSLLNTFFTTKTRIETQLRNDIGANFNPGIVITPSTVLYGVVGIERARLNVNSQSTSTFIFGPANAIVPAIATESKYITGFRLGLGLLKYVTPHLVLGLEYNHTDYPLVNTFGFGSSGTFTNAVNTQVTTKTNEWIFKADWYFNSAIHSNVHSSTPKVRVSLAPMPLYYKPTPVLAVLPKPAVTMARLPRPTASMAHLPRPSETQLS